MNTNLDSIKREIQKLSGLRIKSLFGENLNVYYFDRIFFQFHKGLWLLVENENDEEKCFHLNGLIKESDSGEDVFQMTVKETQEKMEGVKNGVLYPAFLDEKGNKAFWIKKVDIYVLPDGSNSNDGYPFALVFNCAQQKQFMVRFEFPADGLHVSFEKKQIKDFFGEDYFGKKLVQV